MDRPYTVPVSPKSSGENPRAVVSWMISRPKTRCLLLHYLTVVFLYSYTKGLCFQVVSFYNYIIISSNNIDFVDTSKALRYQPWNLLTTHKMTTNHGRWSQPWNCRPRYQSLAMANDTTRISSVIS